MTEKMEIRQRPELPENPRPIVNIGGGGIVRDAHLPAYAMIGFKSLGVFDPDQDKARKLVEDFGLGTVYSSVDDAINQVPDDTVFDVATPASVIPDILNVIPDESAVLIQKPMGENLEEALVIRELCRVKNLKAAVNFQLRYAPNIAGARSIIAQGIIGEIHDMEININVLSPWHLWDWMATIPRVEIVYHSIHYVDLIRSFMGDPEGVYAKTTNHPSAAHMEATRSSILLDYGENRRAGITTNHGHNFGDDHQWAYVKWEGTEGAVYAQIGLVMDYPRGKPDTLQYCLGKGDQSEWIDVPLEGTWYPHAFVGTMASLQRYVEGSADTCPTSIEDAFNTMAVVEAAYDSSEGGGSVIRYSLSGDVE